MTMANNKEKKVLNVPNLRFPEFTDKWEAGKLEEYILLVSGQDLSSEQYTDKEDVYPYITGASSLNSEGIILNRWTHTPTQIVKRGDILLVCKGSGVGQLTVLSNVDKAHIARQIMGIRAKNTESQLFIYHYLSRLMTELKKRSTGIIPGIDRKSILSLHISIPSLQEQQKVAELLSLIEQRIITQNKIIEKLQSLIKGLRVCCMQRVYGNNVYLSEIAQIYQPQTISSTELTEDGFLVYGANGIIGKYKDYNHETEQICITCRGNTCGMVNYTKPMSWITGNAMVINTDKYQDKVCKRYLYHYLSAYNFNSIISGSGQPQIVRTPLEKFKITLPTISEQKQKAIIFDKIQDKIDINHKVLNLYIGQKRYLLRQMFI